jgi:FKBP-type peptidyl-prolyl cis-trans isomerase SlyD
MKIEKDKVVFIDYLMSDESGDTLEDTGETSRTGFLFGHEAMMPAIEEALTDKEAGDEITLNLSPADAFGERHEELVEQIERSKFSKEMSFVEGSEFEVPGPDGHPEVIRVQEVTDTHVTLDRNHPMAGKALSCSVTVREVRDATTLEIEHGHPMQEDSDCGCSGH